MKKVINWFKKRTASRLFIVLFAACTIGFLIVGKWEAALIEFAFFVAWVAIEVKDNTIEVQDKSIRMLLDDLDNERKQNIENWIYIRFLKQKYSLEKTKLDFINGKISADEFWKAYNYHTEQIEKSIEESNKRKDKPQGS